MSFKSFLISKTFFKHLGLVIIASIILLFVTIKALDIYTANGEYISIPDLQSLDADSLLVLASNDYLQYQIVDSVYADKRMPGTVVMQHPSEGAKVKRGRKIYLTIVAKTPEMVKMPNLVDLSIRRAVDIVEYSHLKIEFLIFEDDIALNAVLRQEINGIELPADTLLNSGTEIQLVVGNGYKKTDFSIPFLLGKTSIQAEQLILKSSFNIGTIDTLEENYEGDLRVYKQMPYTTPNHPLGEKLGSKISFSLRSAYHYNFDSLVNFHMLPDSVKYDSLGNIQELTDF